MQSCSAAENHLRQQQSAADDDDSVGHVMSEELDWELSDIFDGGMFAFPVYETSAARRVVLYLLRRGVLPEEVASAIEQPGSTTDLVAWLSGDERKTMVGVWAMAWLNDARRRYDRSRQPPAAAAVDAASSGLPYHPPADRQPSVDSDFGGSGDDESAGTAASRKDSFGDGLSTDYSDQVITDDDELSSASGADCSRRRSRCSRRTCHYLHGDIDLPVPPSRPRSQLIIDYQRLHTDLFVIDVADSGNVSDACAGSVCALDRKSCSESGLCRCTLAHYTRSADALISDVRL